MRNYLKQLDIRLSAYPEKISYGRSLPEEEIQQFEMDNGIRLPAELRMFYQWKNGIKIGRDFQFFSLEEALVIHRNRQMKGVTPKTVSDIPVEISSFCSSEEARRFQEEFRKSLEDHGKEKNFRLPVFAAYRPSVTNYYELQLSKIDKENPQWTLLTIQSYSEPFYAKIDRLHDGRITNCFTDLSAILAESLNQMEPPKASFRQGIKDVLLLMGRLFERNI